MSTTFPPLFDFPALARAALARREANKPQLPVGAVKLPTAFLDAFLEEKLLKRGDYPVRALDQATEELNEDEVLVLWYCDEEGESYLVPVTGPEPILPFQSPVCWKYTPYGGKEGYFAFQAWILPMFVWEQGGQLS
jgi:hypothetical protein